MDFREYLKESKFTLVKVPNNFKDFKSLVDWFIQQPMDSKFKNDLIDPETGEVLLDQGATKKKAIKDRGKFLDALRTRMTKDEYEELKVPVFYNEKNLKDFESFYNIAYSVVSKKLDHPKEMKDAGYDIESKMPSIIKRKDNYKLTSSDKDTIESYIEWYADNELPFDVSLGADYKSNRVELYPILGEN